MPVLIAASWCVIALKMTFCCVFQVLPYMPSVLSSGAGHMGLLNSILGTAMQPKEVPAEKEIWPGI
jgi:hypothetical protein